MISLYVGSKILMKKQTKQTQTQKKTVGFHWEVGLGNGQNRGRG